MGTIIIGYSRDMPKRNEIRAQPLAKARAGSYRCHNQSWLDPPNRGAT